MCHPQCHLLCHRWAGRYNEYLAYKRDGVSNANLLRRVEGEGGAYSTDVEGGLCRLCDRVLRMAAEDPTGMLHTLQVRPPAVHSAARTRPCVPACTQAGRPPFFFCSGWV